MMIESWKIICYPRPMLNSSVSRALQARVYRICFRYLRAQIEPEMYRAYCEARTMQRLGSPWEPTAEVFDSPKIDLGCGGTGR